MRETVGPQAGSFAFVRGWKRTIFPDELLALCIRNERDAINDDLSSWVYLCVLAFFERLLYFTFLLLVASGGGNAVVIG